MVILTLSHQNRLENILLEDFQRQEVEPRDEPRFWNLESIIKWDGVGKSTLQSEKYSLKNIVIL